MLYLSHPASERHWHNHLHAIKLCWRMGSAMKSEQIHQWAADTKLIKNVKTP